MRIIVLFPFVKLKGRFDEVFFFCYEVFFFSYRVAFKFSLQIFFSFDFSDFSMSNFWISPFLKEETYIDKMAACWLLSPLLLILVVSLCGRAEASAHLSPSVVAELRCTANALSRRCGQPLEFWNNEWN